MRTTYRVVTAVAALSLLSGCGFRGVSSLPLPGAKAADESTSYRVTVQFEDVLDLVPYSALKVHDANVGHVRSVRLVDGHAEVEVQISDEVALPANAVGRVAETSLLGEKYVSLDPPRDEPPTGRLHDGDVVPLAQTSSGASVEEVLSALSLVLNGGGLEQVRTIATELNAALQGREGELRSVLTRLDVLVSGLDAQKGDIVRALRGIDRLAATLRAQDDVLVSALEQLPPALAVLAEQRTQLTGMLTSLDRLGAVGTRVVNASRDDLLANLRDLQPTLTELAKAGEDIPTSLDIVLLYPFTRGTDEVFDGDFGNVWLTIDLEPAQLARNLGPAGVTLPTLPGVPGVPGLPSVPTVPGVPLPGLPSRPPVPSAPLVPAVPAVPLRAPALPSAAGDAASDIADMLFGVLR